MKKLISFTISSICLLNALSPIHDIMDSKLKGKSFGGTLDDHDAASDGLGIIPLQNHSGTRDINNELIEHKVLNKLLKSETDKTKTADVRTSLTSGNLGTEEDKNILTNVGVELVTTPVFTSHRFTNCGQTGRTGPTLEQCKSEYNTDWDENPEYFKMTTQGIQEWVVPEDGIYKIIAAGAEGGGIAGSPSRGGDGAVIKANYLLRKGDVIKIAVGQTGGTRGGSDSDSAGSGGGGTFVVLDSKILIAAGGGGGSGSSSTSNGNASLTPSGQPGTGSAGLGGTSGGGGGGAINGSGGDGSTPGRTGFSCSYGAGGGGYSSNGGANCSGSGIATYGQSFVSGALGGFGDTSKAGPEGGFGGGAGVGHRAGAGGGYSGGGGDGGTGSGGGGGSYYYWYIGGTLVTSVSNTGMGYVDIQKLD